METILLNTLLSKVTELEKRIGTIDAKLDTLLKHSNVNYDPCKGLSEEITKALKDGDKIKAIEIYRNVSGTGLKEAKDFIEEGIKIGQFDMK
jgi:ribosomal protein L7/L12